MAIECDLLASPAVTKQSEQRDSQLCTGQLDLLFRRQFVRLLDAPGRSVRRLRARRPCYVEITEVLAAVEIGMRIPGGGIHAAIVGQADATCGERERRRHYKLLAQ